MNEQRIREALWPEEEGLPEELGERIHKAVRRGVRRRKTRVCARAAGSVLAGFLLLVCLASFSPTVALALTEVPTLADIIMFARNDPGLMLAINHNYIQKIGQTHVVNGTRVALEYAMVDEHGMILFIDQNEGDGFWFVTEVIADGEPVTGNRSSSGSGDRRKMLYNLSFEGGWTVPEHVSLVFSQPSQDVPLDESPSIAFDFAIDKSIICPPKHYQVELNAELGNGLSMGQMKMEVYPTVAVVSVYSPAGAGEEYIAGFEEARLITNQGETFALTGASWVGGGRNQNTLTFQSPYFSKAKGITVSLGQAVIQETEPALFSIDLANRQLVDFPFDITIDAVERGDEGMTLSFSTRDAEAAEVLQGRVHDRLSPSAEPGAFHYTGGSSANVEDENGLMRYEMTMEFIGAYDGEILPMQYTRARKVPLPDIAAAEIK